MDKFNEKTVLVPNIGGWNLLEWNENGPSVHCLLLRFRTSFFGLAVSFVPAGIRYIVFSMPVVVLKHAFQPAESNSVTRIAFGIVR